MCKVLYIPYVMHGYDTAGTSHGTTVSCGPYDMRICGTVLIHVFRDVCGPKLDLFRCPETKFPLQVKICVIGTLI